MVFGLWGCQFFDGTMILHAACQAPAWMRTRFKMNDMHPDRLPKRVSKSVILAFLSPPGAGKKCAFWHLVQTLPVGPRSGRIVCLDKAAVPGP
jgi:hypothetical protein